MANSPNERPPRSIPPSPEEAERAAELYRPSWEVDDADSSLQGAAQPQVAPAPIIPVDAPALGPGPTETALSADPRSTIQPQAAGPLGDPEGATLKQTLVGISAFENIAPNTEKGSPSPEDTPGKPRHQNPTLVGIAPPEAVRSPGGTGIGAKPTDPFKSTLLGLSLPDNAGSEAPTQVTTAQTTPTRAIQELVTPATKLTRLSRPKAELNVPSVVVEQGASEAGKLGAWQHEPDSQQSATIPVRIRGRTGRASSSSDPEAADTALPRRSKAPLIAAIVGSTIAVAAVLALSLGGSSEPTIDDPPGSLVDTSFDPGPEVAPPPRYESAPVPRQTASVPNPETARPKTSDSTLENQQPGLPPPAFSRQDPAPTPAKSPLRLSAAPAARAAPTAAAPPLQPPRRSAPAVSPPPKANSLPKPNPPTKPSSVIVRESPF